MEPFYNPHGTNTQWKKKRKRNPTGDDIEIPAETEGEIETETGTKDADLDEGGAHKEDTETEKAVESDSFDTDIESFSRKKPALKVAAAAVVIAAGIDMNKHVRHINAAVRKYQPTADKLALDMTNAQPEPLEIIWDRIQDKTRQYSSIRAYSKNQIISEQICSVCRIS